MYWHKPATTQHHDDSDILGPLAEPLLLDSLTEATTDNSAFGSLPAVEFTTVIPRRARTPSPSPAVAVAARRSPSLPPSPSRPSPPVLTTFSTTTSTFSSSTLPARWVSSFLTYRGPPPPPRSVSPTPTPTPALAVPQARLGTNKRAAADNITHGSPFAATPFVPASGAPGFDGDRAWNKGFDGVDDKSADGAERRGVQLLGRKESTRAVLGTALANTVRVLSHPIQS